MTRLCISECFIVMLPLCSESGKWDSSEFSYRYFNGIAICIRVNFGECVSPQFPKHNVKYIWDIPGTLDSDTFNVTHFWLQVDYSSRCNFPYSSSCRIALPPTPSENFQIPQRNNFSNYLENVLFANQNVKLYFQQDYNSYLQFVWNFNMTIWNEKIKRCPFFVFIRYLIWLRPSKNVVGTKVHDRKYSQYSTYFYTTVTCKIETVL